MDRVVMIRWRKQLVLVAVLVAVMGNYIFAKQSAESVLPGSEDAGMNAAAEMGTEGKEATESWAGWAKEKIQEGLGMKHTTNTAPDDQSSHVDDKDDTKDKIRQVVYDASQSSADKAKEMKDTAYDQTQRAAHKTAEKTQEASEKTKDRAYDAATKASDKLTRAKEEAKEASDKAYQHTKDKIGEAAGSAKDMGRSAVEESKKRGEEVEENLNWAKNKAKEGYEAARHKAEETIGSARDKVGKTTKSEKLDQRTVDDKLNARGLHEEEL